MSRHDNSQAISYRPSVCPLDCPDTCSLSVGVVDNEIVSISGSSANPYTDSAICSKVSRFYPEFVHGHRRLTHPLCRTGEKGEGHFERIGWDEALNTIHEKFSAIINTYGAEAIAPFNYSGPHGMLSGGSMDMRFFYRLGASQLDRGPLCAGISGMAYDDMYGKVPGLTPEQALHSRLVVIWGNNTAVSNLHLHRVLKTVRENGGKVIVVDPRKTKIARQSDLHLPLIPGTDVVLAHAIACLLEKNGGIDLDFVQNHVSGFDSYMQEARRYTLEESAEICGLAVADIKQAARLYQELSPAALNVGIGPERNRCGGAGIRAALALPALAGKFGVDGGGIIGKAGHIFPKTTNKLQRPDLLSEKTRTLNILDIPVWTEKSNDDSPVKALFMYNHNAVAVHPDQNRLMKALQNEDLFVVACDVEMNDSVKFADIVLPACTHFEHEDLYAAYGQNYLQRAEPVIDPVGDALPNMEIFRRLAKRFGFDDAAFQADDQQLMQDAFDESDPRMKGKKLKQLPLNDSLRMTFDGEGPILFKNCYPQTANGKIILASDILEEKYGALVPRFKPMEKSFPLILITPSSMKRTNATFGGAKENVEQQQLDMHPDDARSRGLQNGQVVRVENNLGDVELVLHITNDVRPGIICCAKGAWRETSATGQTCNALIPASKSDIADGACYNDTAVEVVAADTGG